MPEKLSNQEIEKAVHYFMERMTLDEQKRFSARAKELHGITHHPVYLVVLDAVAAFRAHKMLVLNSIFSQYEDKMA